MRFRYLAKDFAGKTVKGEIEVNTSREAAEMIRGQKLYPMEIKPVRSIFDQIIPATKVRGVGVGEIANFTRQLATMITAGLPLTDALNLLVLQSSPKLSKVAAGIMKDVQGGVSLSEAMAKYPGVFSKVYVALVKAAEAAGVMESVLNQLADNTEKSREFRSKMIGAMIYPVIILLGMIGVTVLVVIVVIPKLSDLYKDFGAELPIMTKILIGVSDFSVKFWWLILLAVAGLFFGLPMWLRTNVGRQTWENIQFKLPVIGSLVRQVMLTEFARTLALLVGAGISVVEALDIVAEAVGNTSVERSIKKMARQVEKGFPVSICFSENPYFPPIVGQMAAVGEETGKLDEVMKKLAHFFEGESETKVKALTTAIEPIILIIMAVGVGFLMYAVVMPLYGVMNKI